jgi:hypothetical protein
MFNRYSTGQSSKRLAIFGKSESLRKGEPDTLIEAVRWNSSGREYAALLKTMGSCFLKDFPQLFGLKGEKSGVAATRLFTCMNLRWAGPKEGDELGEGCSELMGEGDLADRSGCEIGEGGVGLPENMENDISIGGICAVTVGIPIGGVAMYFNISWKRSPVLCKERGAKEVRAWAMIPDSRMFEGNQLSLKGGEGISDKKLEPDSLKNGFWEYGAWLLPEHMALNPFPIWDWHRD